MSKKYSSQEIYKISNKNGNVIYTNSPAGVTFRNASFVKAMPLRNTQLEEVTGYVIYLSNGQREKAKKASSDGMTVNFSAGPIETELPVSEVRGVEELYRIGNETGSRYLDFKAGF